MWTTPGNLMIYEGKTTEHNHLKQFTSQEILSFYLRSLSNQASAWRTTVCWTRMTFICHMLLRQSSTITWMEHYGIQVGIMQFLVWYRDKDSYCGCMSYGKWLPVKWKKILSAAQKTETVWNIGMNQTDYPL